MAGEQPPPPLVSQSPGAFQHTSNTGRWSVSPIFKMGSVLSERAWKGQPAAVEPWLFR